MKDLRSAENKMKFNRKKWLAYAAAGAATTGAFVATNDEVCAQIVVNSNIGASLLPADVMPGTVLGGSGGMGIRARFTTSLNGNGQITLDAIHPFSSFGRLLGQATGGARLFGLSSTDTFTSSGLTFSNQFNFPANAALGARFSTLQTQFVELNSGPTTSAGGSAVSNVGALADPVFVPSRTNDQFGQTYLATAPTTQEAFLAFTFDDAVGQQFGFIRLDQVTPGLLRPAPPGSAPFGLNGFVVQEVAFTTQGQLDLDRGFSVGVIPTSVPEPGSMAVLALGAIGVAAWRRRRIYQDKEGNNLPAQE